MIAFIEGTVAHKDPTSVVIDVGGIGYEIKISLNTYSPLLEGKRSKLFTHLHVKEDSHTLFGFLDQEEKKVFLHLISISGVGPNTALLVLSSLSVEEVKRAIVTENVKIIQNVKGIGAKTAQRIILELKDKFKTEEIKGSPIKSAIAYNTIVNEALTALVTLGFPKNVAEKKLEAVVKKEGPEVSLEDLIKLALKSA